MDYTLIACTLAHSLVVFLLQVAVCNLASIALNRFVTADRRFDFHKLSEVTKVGAPDITYYTYSMYRNGFFQFAALLICEIAFSATAISLIHGRLEM